MAITEELFTVEGSAHGPYAAIPVPDSWGPYDPISVTRDIAERIVHDLMTCDAGCDLTAAWEGSNLVFTRDDERSEIIRPQPDGRYRIGGLWPWAPWETARQKAVQALTEWGITAHDDEDAGRSWLIIGWDQSAARFPHMLAEPYMVLYLYNDADDDLTITRPPVQGDRWHVVAGDGTGVERTLTTYQAGHLDECVTAIAEWVTDPLPTAGAPMPTAGAVLLAALTQRGITVHTDWVGMSYAVPLDSATPAPTVRDRPHLSVADRNCSIDHAAADHTGWTVFLHGESGNPIGDPLYIAGDGAPINCAADSTMTAEFIANLLNRAG